MKSHNVPWRWTPFMECGFCAFINPNGRLFHNALDFQLFRKTWTQIVLSQVSLELKKQGFLWLSLLLAGVTDVHLRRLLIGLESKECCRLWMSSTSFSSYLLAAAGFAVSQALVLQVTRNCVTQLLLVLTWTPSDRELSCCHQCWRPEERPVALPGVCNLDWPKGMGDGAAKWSYEEGNAGGAV